MDNLLGPQTSLGYCTNVHAGANWAQTRDNLETHALQVKESVCADAPMAIGLWLSSVSTRDIIDDIGIEHLRDWLESHGLRAFTFNGFPHGDFHQPVVKHLVYRPNWGETARLKYTLDLIEIMAGLMEEGEEGSISTLPVGWGKLQATQVNLETATSHLLSVSNHLRKLEQDCGKLIHLNLEPEPGCYLDCHQDITDFFKDRMLLNGDEESVLRYIRVCHDICHSAVMFEDQAEVFKAYSSVGIQIGKVQISSAIRVDLSEEEDSHRSQAIEQLRAFQEDRYLHQTVARLASGEKRFFEDLPLALDHLVANSPREVRVHFHVPLFLSESGALGTTQDQVISGMNTLFEESDVRHFEVETYAWEVLPATLREPNLADGIARELNWVKETFPN